MTGLAMNPLGAQIRRDIALGWRGRGQALVMLGFFLIIITLFPLAAGPDAAPEVAAARALPALDGQPLLERSHPLAQDVPSTAAAAATERAHRPRTRAAASRIGSRA